MPAQRGFTLIEIVFVIAVLGVLATFAVQGLGGSEKITALIVSCEVFIIILTKAPGRRVRRGPYLSDQIQRTRISKCCIISMD
ncbi:hypothetical protein SPICUR_04105 [Spiribacter curvatus]|uniref:Prepilin-type N-terminal cleavage/methylation domain-containing protein n=1 Tax=Spiribacter curvatus TaxID=1335757 RepID=U5T2Z5_9GAMM|nr:hypothetical protein SPICUR_04105 [Spiribacter curvatus]